MKFSDLDGWLTWQEGLHPSGVELGLERIGRVARAAGFNGLPFTVVTVAGTNGKGSCIAYLEQIYLAAGLKVGAYTSPHLHRYNERIRVDGLEATDKSLMRAFEFVERTRGPTSLTYFEFGTLAAMEIFRESFVTVALLEVGLGGRLDAVNVFDTDLALITPISLDHQDWLGGDREAIAAEKAGIVRSGKPTVCADSDIPVAITEACQRLSSDLYRLGQEFSCDREDDLWCWRGPDMTLPALPLPGFGTDAQLGNAAAAVMAVVLLQERHRVSENNIRDGIRRAQLNGRFQIIPGDPEWIFDVAHNQAAAADLASQLASLAPRRTVMVAGLLKDKDAHAIVAALAPEVDAWIAVSLPSPRSLTASELAETIRQVTGAEVAEFPDPVPGAEHAAKCAGPDARIVVVGSFFAVGPALEWHAVYSAS